MIGKIGRGVPLCQCTSCLKVFFLCYRGLQLESYRSTPSPLELCLPVFSSLVSARYVEKVLTQFRAGARSGMEFYRQYSRQGSCSAKLYRHRHQIENFFQKLKHYRRVATRYDKLGETFMGLVCLAILLTLRLT